METMEQRVSRLEAQIAELMPLVAAQPRRIYMADVIRFQLPKVLPELAKKHREGVTTQHVADHFGFPLASTVQAISRLVKAGKIVRLVRPRERASILLLPGEAPPPVIGLTPTRRRVLNGLARLSNNGHLQLSLRQIATDIGIDSNTLTYTITCLIADKRVKLIKQGRVGEPNTYFIPSAIQ